MVRHKIGKTWAWRNPSQDILCRCYRQYKALPRSYKFKNLGRYGGFQSQEDFEKNKLN